MARYTKSDQAAARVYLETVLSHGDTIYCNLRSVARSGMSRTIDFYAMVHGEPNRITYSVAVLTDNTTTKDGALRVPGCGMDMGFAVVYDLAWKLYGDGYALKHRWM